MHIAAEPPPVPVGGAGLIGLFRESARRDPRLPRERLGESRHGYQTPSATDRRGDLAFGWATPANLLANHGRIPMAFGLVPHTSGHPQFGPSPSAGNFDPRPALGQLQPFRLICQCPEHRLPSHGEAERATAQQRRLYAKQETFCEFPRDRPPARRRRRRGVAGPAKRISRPAPSQTPTGAGRVREEPSCEGSGNRPAVGRGDTTAATSAGSTSTRPAGWESRDCRRTTSSRPAAATSRATCAGLRRCHRIIEGESLPG